MDVCVRAENRLVWAVLGTQLGVGADGKPGMKGPEGKHLDGLEAHFLLLLVV